MKTLLFIFLCGLPFIANSQTITAPRSVIIAANSTNADPGDFKIAGFSSSAVVLVGISLENFNSGTSLSFPITNGLTRSTGYNTFTSVTSINFRGTQDNINVALTAMTLTMGATRSDVKISISIQEYDANFFYNPINNHFYRYIAGTVTYSAARTAAAGTTYKGKTGYLLTITSQSENDFININTIGTNIWFALSDEGAEGIWKIDAGPENGITIKTQNGQTAGNVSGQYNNWCSNEPNNSNNEDYAVTKWNGGTCWNDVSGSNGSILGYIIEYSENFPSLSNFSGVFSSSVVLNGGVSNSIASGGFSNSSTWDNAQNISNGATIQNGHDVNVTSAAVSGKVDFIGTGKMSFNSSGKWMLNPLQTSLKNCKDIKDFYPMAASGRYTIDPDGVGVGGTISCECDMTADGGGWTLVLNYQHLGGTNPNLSIKNGSLPLLGATVLGTDESSSATTWGHIQPSYLNVFAFSELRFYGITSGHSRMIHFKTSHSNTISYFKTGTGSMTGINIPANFTTLSGHTAFLPASTASYLENMADNAMTDFPFWRRDTFHWGIRGHGTRWEVDDFPGTSGNNTFHQIWIR